MIEKKISIPNIGEIGSQQSFVIVGANGSGKSHLGAWIEKNNNNVLRISAQRALTIPKVIDIKGSDSAWNTVLYGNPTEKRKGYKWQWGQETSTLVNDYTSVLSLVFSTESQELRDFKNKCDRTGSFVPYTTIVEKIYQIWNSIMPQREISLDNFDVLAKNGNNQYKAGQMSDGERVCLYLIAQCLVATDGYTIVIDEPEIHLHTSIMKKLWDKIEEYCPNKTFVYITHNSKFALSRDSSTKIWVKSYNGSEQWDIQVIGEHENIPEDLLLEILGTRRPVLFVEGKPNSYDLALYRNVYSDYHVIACDNCQKVIELTKAFNNEHVKQLHESEIKGLIDHDFLTKIEIEAYKKNNIYVISVSEVENLFLIEPIIRLAAKQIGEDDEKVFMEIHEFVFAEMTKFRESIISSMCVKEVRHLLKGFNSEGQSKNDIQNDLNNCLSSIDVAGIYKKSESAVDEILNNKDYKGMIRMFNNKGLCKQAGGKIGFKKPYPQVIIDLLKGEKREEIINALKEYLPQF